MSDKYTMKALADFKIAIWMYGAIFHFGKE